MVRLSEGERGVGTLEFRFVSAESDCPHNFCAATTSA